MTEVADNKHSNVDLLFLSQINNLLLSQLLLFLLVIVYIVIELSFIAALEA